VKFAATPSISERDRRTLMIGAVVVLALLTVFRGIPAWRGWVRESQTAAENAWARLAVARSNAAGGKDVARRADSLSQASLALVPAFVSGDTPAQAGATLAAHVSETAAAAGVQLSGVQLTVDSLVTGQTLYHVRVHADGSGDIRGVTTLFQLLEGGGAPVLAIRSFAISQSDLNSPPNRAESLRVSFEVDALAHRESE